MVSQSSAAHSDHTETEQTGRREEAQCSPGGFLSGSAWLHPGVRMTLAQQETLPHPPHPLREVVRSNRDIKRLESEGEEGGRRFNHASRWGWT